MLFDLEGKRKYLVAHEQRAFLKAADRHDPATRAFCWTLAYTGARLSEVRVLTPRSFDIAAKMLILRCLKRRTVVFRALPIPSLLLNTLDEAIELSSRRDDSAYIDKRIWPWGRTTAWSRVRDVARAAGLPEHLCMPKALRHSFGIEGVSARSVPLGLMKKWMGHARLESTLIYTTPVGAEERAFAEKMWCS